MKKIRKNKKYYDLTPILELDCEYNVILGERTNGKSFAVKDHILRDSLMGKYFCYVRRWKQELKAYEVERYFSDFILDYDEDGNEIRRIYDMTNGEYTTILCTMGSIYLANEDEFGRKDRGIQIGYYFSLASQALYKSQSFPFAYNFVFEEFVTTSGYLPNEPKNLLHLISTIFRQRIGKIFLIGNTINRTFPYIKDWGLTHILQQPRGTIEIYDVSDGENTIRIAVEITDTKLNNNRLAFGKNVNSITNGEWEVDNFLHLEKRYEEYHKLYIMFAVYQYMIFRISLIREDKILFLYIDDWNEEIPEKSRVVTNSYNCSIMYSRRFQDVITIYDKTVLDLLRRGKFVFKNDLIGTDFCASFDIE